MTISYNWLKDYLKADLSIDQLSVILTDIGLEVDGIEKVETIKGGLDGVVVGQILTCEKHADADKLKVTTVEIGAGEPLQIVCGAPNVAAGQKVLVATINTTLYPNGEPDGFKIKRSKIRGVESLGMICAADELGIGQDHSGIMVLDDSAVAGTTAKDFLGIEDDYVIEIGLTPNRIDAASHFGVARDLAAYLKVNGIPAELSLPEVVGYGRKKDGRTVGVCVEDAGGAPRYAGVTITDIKIGPSPEWLQKKLRAIGINPKNNVVDITNFVLHETGQPLHAFDADRIGGDRIIVKTCPEGTPFVTLDEVERTLSSSDLMICGESGPLCIAGVFGGIGSGVSEATTTVFLESAYFNPTRIRKTAKRHGLNTDSSFRFERGADPNMTIYALKRAALLIEELAGGTISSEITDIYPVPVEDFRFDISLSSINRLTGKDLPAETVKNILGALSINIEQEDGDKLTLSVPPFRVDVQREADIAEEILRIYGYNNVEIPQRIELSVAHSQKPDIHRLRNTAADHLTANGYTEIMSNSLTRSSYYESLNTYRPENSVRILNPLSTDLNVMRQTLLFNSLEAVQLNVNRKNANLKLYEFGNCYFYDPAKKEIGGLAPYSEVSRMAITVTGNRHNPSWSIPARPTDFYTLRSSVETLLTRFGLDIYALQCETSESDLFSEGLSFCLNGKQFMEMGIVSAAIREKFDIKQEIYFAELDFGVLCKSTKNNRIVVEDLSKYPEVKRDLALLIDKEVTFSTLRKIAFSAEKKLLKSVSLLDVYEGEKLPEGKKSYTLTLIIEDKTRTLTDNITDKIMNNLVNRFAKECGAAVRTQ